MSHFALLALIALSIYTSSTFALLDCRDPPAETETFFDLYELNSLAATYPAVFQTPVKCTNEAESSNCANQICCGEEISCCYHDTEDNRQICGCKGKTDTECTRGPPLAYVRTYRCEDHHSAESYICIRKNKEGETNQGSVTTYIGPVSRNDALDALIASGQTVTALLDDVELSTGDLLGVNGGAPGEPVDGLPLGKLMDIMDSEKLYQLAQQVMERHEKGLKYGRQKKH